MTEAFKTATPEVAAPSPNLEGAGENNITVGSASEGPSPSIYQEVRGKPLAAEIFDLGGLYGKFNSDKDTEMIDQYVLDQMSEQKLQDTKENYNHLFKQIESALGLTERHDRFHRIKTMKNYIKVVGREQFWRKQRERLTDGKSNRA